MNFKDYQKQAMEFAEYKDEIYPFLALAEETGEFLSLLAKARRGDYDNYSDEDLNELSRSFEKEAGDVLWQLTACLRELGSSLEDVAELNINKLQDRKNRDKIKGSGDNR